MVAAWAGAAVSRIDAIETTRRIDSQYHVRKADDERQNDRSITVMVDLIDLAAQAAMTSDISPRPRLSPVDAAGHAAAPRDELAPPSFDYLVGARQHARRHFEAERLRGRKINDQLELGRQFDWEIGGFSALENPAGVDAGTAIGIEAGGGPSGGRANEGRQDSDSATVIPI
jgi:hypothetical protein